MAPVTITYVSSPENEELSTPGARIHAKSLGWAEREEGIQPYAQTRNLRGPIFEEQGPVPLSPEQFADLWSALEETGILSIALSRAREPPRDRPYFLFEDARRRWIITRPNLAGIGDDSERAEDLARGLRAWQEAKTVIAIAGNAYGL